jgi:purine-binding chemotaxis protein CheW
MSPALPVDALAGDAEDASRRLLLVSLEDAVVALPAEPLVEILPARPYARLPGAPAAVAGLANRRGRMLTVVDLGAALGTGAAVEDDGHRVVVVSWRGRELGIAVKDVLQITSAWWSDSSDHEGQVSVEEEEAGGAVPDSLSETAGDQQLRVVELDSVLAPLFGGEGRGVEEPDSERS